MKKFTLFVCLNLLIAFATEAQPGANDPSFNQMAMGIGSEADSTIHSITIQSNGQVIIGGQFTTYNGIAMNRIARLKVDGSPDPAFNIGSGANNTIYTTAQQSDGRIIIAGNFTVFNGTTVNRMARLNADGSLDSTFNCGTGSEHCIYASALQNDGKIIFAGDFDTINGTARYRLVRLNVNGSVDTTFDPGLGATCTVYAISLQNNGQLIIGGAFVNYDGTAINRIARLNTDGSLDPSFDPGTGADNNIYTTNIQIDGKIIIGGLFTNYNGIPINHIARLNSNGSLDTTFTTGSAANHVVCSSTIQNDGKIIIGGNFTNFDGTTTNGIARLNQNGSIDAGFNTGSGTNDIVLSTAIQSDGRIIIAGSFTSYNGIVSNRVARIYGSEEVMTPVTETSDPENQIIYPNPNKGDFIIQTTFETDLSIVNSLGQNIQSVHLNANNNFSISISDLNNGIYFIYGINNSQFLKQKILISK